MSTVGPVYHCTCETFSILLPEDAQSSSSDIRWNGTSCMHVRLLAATLSILPSFDSIKEQPTQDATLVKTAFYADINKVVELPAKIGIRRFSVSSQEDDSFVTIVRCHSSVCSIGKGSKRSYEHLTYKSCQFCFFYIVSFSRLFWPM